MCLFGEHVPGLSLLSLLRLLTTNLLATRDGNAPIKGHGQDIFPKQIDRVILLELEGILDHWHHVVILRENLVVQDNARGKNKEPERDLAPFFLQIVNRDFSRTVSL